MMNEVDWFELSLKVATKKFPQNHSRDRISTDKLYRFLQYRGFEHEHIKYAMAEIAAKYKEIS